MAHGQGAAATPGPGPAVHTSLAHPGVALPCAAQPMKLNHYPFDSFDLLVQASTEAGGAWAACSGSARAGGQVAPPGGLAGSWAPAPWAGASALGDRRAFAASLCRLSSKTRPLPTTRACAWWPPQLGLPLSREQGGDMQAHEPRRLLLAPFTVPEPACSVSPSLLRHAVPPRAMRSPSGASTASM